MKTGKKKVKWYIISAFLCSCIFFSCKHNEGKIPDGILHKDTMVVMLTEMQLIEASITARIIEGDANKRALGFYNKVFKNHNITKEQYEASYQYYALHPKLIEEIYNEVLNILSEKQSEIDKVYYDEEE